MKILVTGGAGYIGSVLISQLQWQGDVYVFDNFLYSNQSSLLHLLTEIDNIHLYDKNTSIEEVLKDRFDVIIHLAAIVGQKACDQNPELAIATNVELTRKICQLKRPETFLIFPNTNSGYGNVPNGICDEDTPQNPVSLYGQTKCEAEQIVRNTENAVVFRLATVFGLSPRMRMDLLLTQLVYKAMFDGHIDLFEPHYMRNFVHINDIVRTFEHAIRYKYLFRNQVFNLGNDNCNISKENLVKLIQQFIPCTYNIVDQKDPDQRNYVVSNAKINKHINLLYDLVHGIKQTKQWLSLLPKDKELRERILVPYVN